MPSKAAALPAIETAGTGAAPGTAKGAPTTIALHVSFGNGGSLDPQDIGLLETIRRERSILGASRVLGTSYRKCWLLVDALNHTFETPVVETFPGRRGGGAELTVFGERMIALYRSLERQARKSGASTLAELTAALDPDYEPRASGAGSADRTDERPRSRSPRT
ncbi:winged helix-turn-helix domain-containing protein [Rhodoplanes roseus]|uniref:ModE family transcriptional regulator n=1 Tax=Rhodoplanes roseus TaxID=29409 RepID=A0A327L6P9_9BRAD|nr:LysR family transcriptional regulator [Rhodoplanes roseus]RAI46006.1 ModE family transcriptional regulator [Rhodoplanes roseus]